MAVFLPVLQAQQLTVVVKRSVECDDVTRRVLCEYHMRFWSESCRDACSSDRPEAQAHGSISAVNT
jgi:hypothetical protein